MALHSLETEGDVSIVSAFSPKARYLIRRTNLFTSSVTAAVCIMIPLIYLMEVYLF